MLIRVTELCEVDYVNEEDIKENKEQAAIRVVEYDSDKPTLLEAFEEYENDFDVDRVVECHDEFDGVCIDFIKVLSVEEVVDIKRRAIDIVYDVDENLTDPPLEEMCIPNDIKDDEITDYISGITGHCVRACTIVYEKEGE